MNRSTTITEPPSDCPEFVVTRESFDRYFEKPLPTSTFHDLVNKGRITPFKHMRGHYLLNDSLRRLGLKEVRKLPKPPPEPGLEGIIRLAFTLIDDGLFPAPSWLLNVDAINAKDADHAVRLADQYRAAVQECSNVELKLAYFQGVLDAAFRLSSGA
jgi:hypothetical protein